MKSTNTKPEDKLNGLYKFMAEDDFEESALEVQGESTVEKRLPDIATADIAKKKKKAIAIERNHRKMQRILTLMICMTVAAGFIFYPDLDRRHFIYSSFLILGFIAMIGFCLYTFHILEKRRQKFLTNLINLIGKENPVKYETQEEIKEEEKNA